MIVNKNYEKNSASKEDYLELIYELSLKNPDFKAVDIANKMNISRASVSEALKKLAEQGLVNYEKYKKTTLTEKGLKLAKEVFLKHNVLFTFFKEILHLTVEDAQINACKVEHVITNSAFSEIKKIVDKL